MQVIKEESAARIASSAEVSPSKSPELGGDGAALVKELADVKKRFLAVAKKKQADFAKRVRLMSIHPRLRAAMCADIKGRIPLHSWMMTFTAALFVG